MIYSPEKTEAIIKAMEKVNMSNNGYAFIGNDDEVALALTAAGYILRKKTNTFAALTHNGAAVQWIAYTQKGYDAALVTSDYLEAN